MTKTTCVGVGGLTRRRVIFPKNFIGPFSFWGQKGMYLNSTLKEGGVAYRLSESRNVVDGLIYDKRNECEARVELARVSIYVYICIY